MPLTHFENKTIEVHYNDGDRNLARDAAETGLTNCGNATIRNAYRTSLPFRKEKDKALVIKFDLASEELVTAADIINAIENTHTSINAYYKNGENE